MFRAFSRPSSGAQWLQWQPMVLPAYRGDSRTVFVVGPITNTTNLIIRYKTQTSWKSDSPFLVTRVGNSGLMLPHTNHIMIWRFNASEQANRTSCSMWWKVCILFLNSSPSTKCWETLTSSVIPQQFWYDTICKQLCFISTCSCYCWLKTYIVLH
jgi:hypothetical protein